MRSYFDRYRNLQYVLAENGIITEANVFFCEFTQYDPVELIGKTVEVIFQDLLRCNRRDLLCKESSTIIFTKSLEAKIVYINRLFYQGTNQTKYVITEVPDSNLDEKHQFLYKLMTDNITGIGVYKVPEFMLVNANPIYLSYLPNPYNTKEQAFGKCLKEIIVGFEGSNDEKVMNEIVSKNLSVTIKESTSLMPSDSLRYWDNTIIPLNENGRVGYIVSLLDDITKQVLTKEYVKKQKEEFQAILDNMSDGIIAFDHDGHYIHINKRIREFFKSGNIESGDVQYIDMSNEKYFDINGNELSKKDLPLARVLNGENVVNQRLMYKGDGITYYFECNGSAMKDKHGEIELGIINCRDVTEIINKEKETKQQKEQTIHDITEKKRTQEQLLNVIRGKNEALENSMRIKEESFYLITHEFKTPLTVISSALQTMDLLYKNCLPGKVDIYLNKIKQNTNRQLRLVNNLLDVTRITADKVKLNNEIFDIVYLAESIVNSVQDIALQKGVKIVFSTKLAKKEILIDEEKVERILLNLLSNAVKFTPEGNMINVVLYCKRLKSKSMICISVQDQGIGIPQDKQSHIFDLYGQADRILSYKTEGTGIGLYLVKLLVKAMDGVITLESQEGKGSNFTVMLPANKGLPSDTIQSQDEIETQNLARDHRLIREIAIQFSDIYK